MNGSRPTASSSEPRQSSERSRRVLSFGLNENEPKFDRTLPYKDVQDATQYQEPLNSNRIRQYQMPISISPNVDSFSRKARSSEVLGSIDLYKRETKLVGHGMSSAVVDAQIQKVHGVAADRFLRTGPYGFDSVFGSNTRPEISPAKVYSAALDPSYAALTEQSSTGMRTVRSKDQDPKSELSRCMAVGNELGEECKLLRNRLARSRCPINLPYLRSESFVQVTGKEISDSKILSYKAKTGKAEDRAVREPIFHLGPQSDILKSSGVYASVCRRHGISSASELDTLLGDYKSAEASNFANSSEEGKNAKEVMSENILLQHISDADTDTISIALYLRCELQDIASDHAKATAYKTQLVADLSAVLRAQSSRFEVRGLFEGVVAEIFLRSSDEGLDDRPPAQLAEELAKYIQSKPAILDGTQILRNANSVKVRGLASRARPLAFLMKKLEERQSGLGNESTSEQTKHGTGTESTLKINKQLSNSACGHDSNLASQADRRRDILICSKSSASQEKMTSELEGARKPSNDMREEDNVTLVEVAKSFVGDKTRGHLELYPGMKIILLSTDGLGWCFGNVLGPTGVRHYPAGWFPAEIVRRHDPITVMSEITLDSSSLSLVSDDSLCESESEIDVVEQYCSFDDFLYTYTPEGKKLGSCLECKNTSSEKTACVKSASKATVIVTHPVTNNQFWRVKIEIMDAVSLPNAHTIGLLPDTYVCISLLCANQCNEPDIIIDHCVDNEPAVDDSLLHNMTVFRIPPQAQTSIVERNKNPHWGESFDFSDTRPYFSVVTDNNQRKKLVSTELATNLHGQDIRLMITMHERNLFGHDCWIARSEILIGPSTEESPCVDTWMVLRQFDGSPITSQETTSIARMRIHVHYSSFSCPKDASDINLYQTVKSERALKQKIENSNPVQDKNSFQTDGGGTAFRSSINQSRAGHQKSCDFKGTQELDHRLSIGANLLKRRVGVAGDGTGLLKFDESLPPVLSTSFSIHSKSTDECVAPENSLKSGEITSATLLMHQISGAHRARHCCVEIDLISASNLRKSPGDGLNPNPYFCVSLVTSAILNRINSGYLNHPLHIRGDQSLLSDLTRQKSFEVLHQYRSAVVHHSQVPSWKSKIVLNDVLESTNPNKNIGELKWRDLSVSPMQLSGQSITMLISLYDKSVRVPDRFLGKIIIPLQYPGKLYDQSFPFLDHDGDLMDSSHGYLHIRCRYKDDKKSYKLTQHHFLQSEIADLDLSVTTSSSIQSESYSSTDSSPRQKQPSGRQEVNETSFFSQPYQAQIKTLVSSNMVSVQPVLNSARSEETESSVLKTARSIETVCGVLEPASSLFHSNSFESECWVSRESGENGAFSTSFFESGLRSGKSLNEIGETLLPKGLLSFESQASNVAVSDTITLKAANAFPWTANTNSVAALDTFQGRFNHRSANEPIPANSHVYHVMNTDEYSLPLRDPLLSDNFEIQNQSYKVLTKEINSSANNLNSALGVEDSAILGKCRFILPKDEPSELQKAFMARKLIPTRDQSEY